MRIKDLSSIDEAEGKTASFAFGRMNPPTIGHKKLADTVLAQAGDPYIFLSQSQKPKTDPLDFTTKVALARQFFPGVSVGDPSVKTIIQALTKLDSLGYDNVIYVAGSDRIQDFTELLNKYNGKADKQGNIAYTFKDIQVVSAGERDPDAEGAEGMSASKMRAAAAKGDFEAFKSGTPEPKLAQTMYDRVRAGMGITEEAPPGREKQVKKLKSKFGKEGAYAIAWAQHNKHGKPSESVDLDDRVLKIIETLQDLHRAKPLDEATTQYVLKQVSTIKEHLSNINEARATYELNDEGMKAMEQAIRASAKKHGIDPNVAVKVWKSEGGPNYQSNIKREGPGSYQGYEASFGPFQLHTGGGLGNDYQKKYKVDLINDNNPDGIRRQIDFAMSKAKKVGWKPWYGAAKVGIGDRDGIDGTQYADAGNVATDASVKKTSPGFIDRVVAGGARLLDKVNYFVPEATLDLPDLESGDELMVGKFKNRKATIKDFKKDEHGQPVAVTNKGDQKIFKGRVKKLMPTEGKRIPRKKGQKAGSKKHSDLYTDENPKGTIQGLKFATVKDAEASVSKIRNSGKKHAHKIQAAIAMEQRAKAADKKTAAAVYRSYINSMKKKTKKMSEDALNEKCWDGYKQVGMKKKGKRKVPNCVPESDTTEGKSPHKKGTEKYRKHMAAMHASVEPKGTMIEGVSYADPQFDVEWEEANRYPYLEKLGPEGWEELAKNGRAVRVTKDSVKKIGNTGADGSESLDNLEPEKVARLKQAMDSGTVEMPIVVKQPDGSLELIAGNTRLIGLISTQGEAQVWLVDASTLTEGVGRIVKGVNTTPDVGVNQTKIEAAKLGSKVDKDGRPPVLERGSIGVPLSSGLTVNVAPHRELKIKKSTKGRLNYENPRANRKTKSKRGATV